jgi:hypothetical protein
LGGMRGLRKRIWGDEFKNARRIEDLDLLRLVADVLRKGRGTIEFEYK